MPSYSRAIIASRSSACDDAHQERYFARAIRIIYGAAHSYHRADARGIPLFTRIAPCLFLLENACKPHLRYNHNMITRTVYHTGKNDIPLTGRLSCRHYHYVRGAICAGNIKYAIAAIDMLNQVFYKCSCFDSPSCRIAHHIDICNDAGRHASTNIMRAVLETICQHAADENERKMFVREYIVGLCMGNRGNEYAAMRQLLRAAGTPRDDYHDYTHALYYGSLDICELINPGHDMINAAETTAACISSCDVRGIRYAMGRSPEIAREIANILMKTHVRSGLLVSEEDERFALCWEHPATIAFWRGLSSLDKSRYHGIVNRECRDKNPRVATRIKQRWKDYCAKYS